MGLVKKVVDVMSKDFHLIVDALQLAFNIASENFVIQSWDSDFDDGTNVSCTSLRPVFFVEINTVTDSLSVAATAG